MQDLNLIIPLMKNNFILPLAYVRRDVRLCVYVMSQDTSDRSDHEFVWHMASAAFLYSLVVEPTAAVCWQL